MTLAAEAESRIPSPTGEPQTQTQLQSQTQPRAAVVTLDDVRHVAELANLRLTPDEEPALERDLNSILGYIAQLAELDTTGVPPMAQVSEVLTAAEAQPAAGEHLRPDAVRPSLDRGAVLAEAPETDGRFFKVPKVIER